MEAVSTDSQGRFEADDLAPGRYSIRVESAGFSTVLERGLVVYAGQKTEADAALSVAPIAAEIEVAG